MTFRRSLLLGVFCLSIAVAAEPAQPLPRAVFHASFDKGFDADLGSGVHKPLRADKLTLVDGLAGRGVNIPKDGALIYPIEGNLPRESGTVVMWMKPDWTPARVNTWSDSDWHGLFGTMAGSNVPQAPDPKTGQRSALIRVMQEAMLHFTWQNPAGEMRSWYGGQQDFTAGIWRCYAFAWDAKRGLRFWLDGEELARCSAAGGSLGNADGFGVGTTMLGAGRLRGFSGVVDEVSVYEGFLETAQVAALGREHAPAASPGVEVLDLALFAGRDNAVRVRVHGAVRAGAELRASLSGATGPAVDTATARLPAAAAGDGYVQASLTLNPPKAGPLKLTLTLAGQPPREFAALAISPVAQSAAMPSSTDGKTGEKEVDAIDCAADPDPARYRDDGACAVQRGPAGAWREARGGKKLSGFAYRLSVRNPGRPHWLDIDYPDDAKRSFYVAVFQAVDGKFRTQTLDTIGVLSGGQHALSMGMEHRRLLFWPDSTDLMISCQAHIPRPGDAPPALARIRISEIEGPLPRLELRSAGKPGFRSIGVWNEDPYMPANDWFSQSSHHDPGVLASWQLRFERMIEYMHYSGQDLWDMQGISYFGDRAVLPLSLPQTAGADQIVAGWSELGALTLQREGLGFVLTMQDRFIDGGRRSLGGLAKLIGPERIAWTAEDALARGADSVERVDKNGKVLEKAEPLHPAVQDAYLRAIRACGEKFAPYASFKGITVICAGNLSYGRDGGIDEGYGDYPVQAFEGETGVRVPVARDAPDRFAKRHAWLLANARDRWVAWRCARMIAFHRRLAAELERVAPGRRLQVQFDPPWKDFAAWPAVDLAQLLRERAIDVPAQRAIPGFMPLLAVEPYIERAGLDFGRASGLFRNMRYLGFSSEQSALFSGVVLSYHSNFEVYGPGFGPEQIAALPLPRTTTTQHTFATPLPANRFVLEHLAHLAADFADEWIQHGWWGSPDNGALQEHLPFYRAWRALPKGVFAKVPGASDPVQVRRLDTAERSWLMLVNRESYPVALSLAVDAELRDEVDGAALVPAAGRLALTMGPHQLRSLSAPAGLRLGAIVQTAPAAEVAALTARAGALAEAARKPSPAAGLAEVAAMVDTALRAKAWARVRQLLESGPAADAVKP